MNDNPLNLNRNQLAELERKHHEIRDRLARILGEYPRWMGTITLTEMAAHGLGDLCPTKNHAINFLSATLDYQGKFGAKPQGEAN